MSIDLDWSKLDSSLSSYVVDLLNRQISNTQRPSFIGPVEVTSLDFGSAVPDVELVDLRDIYRDFVEADDDGDEDDDEGNKPVKVTEGASDDDAFEWVSRKATRHNSQDLPAYHHLPPHVRYGRGPVGDMFASTPALHSPRDIWNGSMSLPSLSAHYGTPGATLGAPLYRSPSFPAPAVPLTPSSTPLRPKFGLQGSSLDSIPPLPDDASSSPLPEEPAQVDSSSGPAPAEPPKADQGRPDLQLHLHITWRSDLRITLTTSLLINYPSPMFMSLPIKLSVTGLVFNGEIAVAYEGERGRVHLCVLDDLDPYGLASAGERPKRDSFSATPPELEDDVISPGGIGGSATARSGKPLPVGQRLLPNIYIESEIGQADKHVLKNVTRVEKFIQDVIRKTVEEELVFPNFHTLVMADGT
jgi:distribution and morphology protein 12